MDKWYYNRDGKVVGPVSPQEMKSRVDRGEVAPTDHVSKDARNWVVASKVSGLFSVSGAESPTLPPTSSSSKPNAAPDLGAPLEPPSFTPLSAALEDEPHRGGRKRPSATMAAVVGTSIVVVGIVIAFALTRNGNDENSNATGSNQRDDDADEDEEEPADQGVRDARPRDGNEDEDENEPRDRAGDIESDIEELEQERDELEEEREELRRENRELREQNQELVEQIDELTAQLNELRIWQNGGGDFVLVDADETSVVVDDQGAGGMKVVTTAISPFSRKGIAAAFNAGIPCIRVRRDMGIERSFFTESEPQQEIASEIVDLIRLNFWKEYLFVPDVQQFLAFRDTQTHRFRVGFYLGESDDGEGLLFHGLGREHEVIPQSQMQEGTARVASPDEILAGLTDTDLLDVFTLSIAQKLATQEIAETRGDTLQNGIIGDYVKIAVRCQVDIPDSQLELAEDQLQLVQDYPSDGSPTDFLLRLAGQAVIHESVSDPLDLAAEYLEDEVNTRLYQLGVPIVDQEEIRLAEDIGSLVVEDSLSRKYAERMYATHLALFEVKPALGEAGEYHLSSRLIDLMNGGVVWAGNGDHVTSSRLVGQQFHMTAGELSMMQFTREAFTEQLIEEQPSVFPPDRATLPDRFGHLCYVEQQGSQFYIARSPFRFERLQIPFEQVDELIPLTGAQDVPQGHVMRYLAARISQEIIPNAGRVLEVGDNEARIGLGRNDGVIEGDTLRVLRGTLPDESSADDTFGIGLDLADTRYLLPRELVVTSVNDTTCVVGFPPTGLEEWWPENEELSLDDVVVRDVSSSCVIRLESLEFVNPDGDTGNHISREVTQFVVDTAISDAIDDGAQIMGDLASAFQRLNVPTLNVESEQSGYGDDLTHVLTGTITFSPAMRDLNPNTALRNPIYSIELYVADANQQGENVLIQTFDYDPR